MPLPATATFQSPVKRGTRTLPLLTGIAFGVTYPKLPPNVTKESLLTIILKHGETIQYRIAKVDTKERYVKAFAEEVFQLLTKKDSYSKVFRLTK